MIERIVITMSTICIYIYNEIIAPPSPFSILSQTYDTRASSRNTTSTRSRASSRGISPAVFGSQMLQVAANYDGSPPPAREQARAAQSVEVETGCTLVVGGFLDKNEMLIVRENQVTRIDGCSFMEVDRVNPRIKMFVDDDFAMLDRLTDLRNRYVTQACSAAEGGGPDPLAVLNRANVSSPMVKKRKQAFHHADVPQAIEVTVTTTSGEMVH